MYIRIAVACTCQIPILIADVLDNYLFSIIHTYLLLKIIIFNSGIQLHKHRYIQAAVGGN